jgi:hypothetical protein
MKTVGVDSIMNELFHKGSVPRSSSVIFTAYSCKPAEFEELVGTASGEVALFSTGSAAAPLVAVAGCELGALCAGSTATLLAGCELSMFCCPWPTPAPHAVSRPIKPINAVICLVIFVCPLNSYRLIEQGTYQHRDCALFDGIRSKISRFEQALQSGVASSRVGKPYFGFSIPGADAMETLSRTCRAGLIAYKSLCAFVA